MVVGFSNSPIIHSFKKRHHLEGLRKKPHTNPYFIPRSLEVMFIDLSWIWSIVPFFWFLVFLHIRFPYVFFWLISKEEEIEMQIRMLMQAFAPSSPTPPPHSTSPPGCYSQHAPPDRYSVIVIQFAGKTLQRYLSTIRKGVETRNTGDTSLQRKIALKLRQNIAENPEGSKRVLK